ncbi:hypothetical protein SGRIM128S_08153 [Streptomyces griseomycini]|nr:hypothetical protein GCM10015536_68700 [Streptomyces griseomycini]
MIPAGVPVRLLLGTRGEEATVRPAPSPRIGHGESLTGPFGERLPVPDPSDCTPETSGFGAPRRDARYLVGSTSPRAASCTVHVRVRTGPDTTASAR